MRPLQCVSCLILILASTSVRAAETPVGRAVGVAIPVASSDLLTEPQKTLYVLGYQVGENLQRGFITGLTDEQATRVLAGLADALLGHPPTVDMQIVGPQIQQMLAEHRQQGLGGAGVTATNAYDATVLYGLGVSLGANLVRSGLVRTTPDEASTIQGGLGDALLSRAPRVDKAVYGPKIQPLIDERKATAATAGSPSCPTAEDISKQKDIVAAANDAEQRLFMRRTSPEGQAASAARGNAELLLMKMKRRADECSAREMASMQRAHQEAQDAAHGTQQPAQPWAVTHRAQQAAQEQQIQAAAMAMEKHRLANPKIMAVVLSARICRLQQAKREAVAELAKQTKYSKIGGVTSLADRFAEQQLIRHADEAIDDTRALLKHYGIAKAMGCESKEVSSLVQCVQTRVAGTNADDDPLEFDRPEGCDAEGVRAWTDMLPPYE